jgi:hypothetical protein
MRATVRRPGRALGVLGDQVVWSVNSLLTGVLAARAMSIEEFGSFSAGLVLLLLSLGLGRALFGQPLILRWSGSSVEDVRRATGAGLGPVLAYGAGWAVVATAVLPALGHGGQATWVALALVPVALQDFLRLTALARNAIRSLLFMDLTWLGLQTTGFLVVEKTVGLSVGGAWQVMAVAVACSFAVGLVMLRPDRPGRARAARRHGSSRLAATLGGDFVVSTGLVLVLTSLLPLFAGAAGLAALRGAQTIAGPLQVLQAGVDGALLPEASRRSRQRWSAGVRLCLAVAVAAGAGALCLTGILLSIPDRLGAHLLGDTWPAAEHVLLPVLLRSCTAIVGTAAVVALRATGAATAAFRLRLVTVPLLVAAAVAGASLGSAAGFAWGLLVAQVASTGLWWVFVFRTRTSQRGFGPGSRPSERAVRTPVRGGGA